MSSDDPYGSGGGDWGQPQQPPQQQPQHEEIDMNYGQLPGQDQQQQALGPPNGQLKPTKGKLDNNDIIAIVVGVFLPGVGQLMLGQTTKGIVILLATLFTCYGFGFLWIAVVLDAYLLAMTKKYREVGEWEFFPDMNKHFGSG